MTMKIRKQYRNNEGVDWTWARSESTGEHSHCPDPHGSESVCEKCEGSGKLRHNTWKNGVGTLGKIACDECQGTGNIHFQNVEDSNE